MRVHLRRSISLGSGGQCCAPQPSVPPAEADERAARAAINRRKDGARLFLCADSRFGSRADIRPAGRRRSALHQSQPGAPGIKNQGGAEWLNAKT